MQYIVSGLAWVLNHRAAMTCQSLCVRVRGQGSAKVTLSAGQICSIGHNSVIRQGGNIDSTLLSMVVRTAMFFKAEW